MIEVLLQIPRARHRDVFLEPLLQSMFVVSSPQMRSEMNHQDSLIAMLKADIKECRGREMHKMKELKSANDTCAWTPNNVFIQFLLVPVETAQFWKGDFSCELHQKIPFLKIE